MLFRAACIKDITGYYRISNEIVFFSHGSEGELRKVEGLSKLEFLNFAFYCKVDKISIFKNVQKFSSNC